MTDPLRSPQFSDPSGRLASPAEFGPPEPFARLHPVADTVAALPDSGPEFVRDFDTLAEYGGALAARTQVNNAHDGSNAKEGLGPSLPPAPEAHSSDASAMAGQPPTPPPIDRPPTAFENPEDIPSPERADQIFESHKAASAEPTRDDWFEVLMHLSEVRWLGGETQQCPVAPAFGAENELIRAVRKPDSPEPDESTRRLDPAIEADRIVGRQLTEYTSTMTRVCRGVEDTGKLVGLVAKHAGRRQVATHQLARYESPTSSFNTEGYSIAASPEGMTVTNPSDPLPEFLRYDAPNGEIHLVHRDGSQRYNANIKGGQLDVKHEAVHGVRPEDAEYLAELGKDLKTYQELLLQVADHAGIDRQRVINPRTGLVPLDVEVDTKIANPSLQATLPEALRTKMKAFSQVIAARVNSSQMEGGFDEMAFRLGEYFSAVARNRSFHDR